MHQDHLLVEKYSVNNKREPARNQGNYSRPADLGTWRAPPSGLRAWGTNPPGCRPSNLDNLRPIAISPDFTVQSRKNLNPFPEAMMGNALNLDYFLAVGLQAQNYFLTHILVWNMLVQLIVVGCLYMLARLAAGPVRPWLQKLLKRHPLVEHSLPHLTRVITTRLAQPHNHGRAALVRP